MKWLFLGTPRHFERLDIYKKMPSVQFFQDLLDQDFQPQNEMPFIDTMCLVRQMGICSVDHRSVTLVDFQIVVTGLTDTWGG